MILSAPRTRRGVFAALAATAALSFGSPVLASQTPSAPPSAGAGSDAASRSDAFEARSADGTILRGDVSGDPAGPEILLIHGLRQSRLSWDKQLADPALAGFRIVRFDLRGHGDSDKPTSADAYKDLSLWSDDIAAVIAATRLRRPVLVGWSLGGMLIGGYLQKYGGADVAGVNLVDAVTRISAETLFPITGEFAQRTASLNLDERASATAEFLLDCFHQAPTAAELQRMLVINGMTSRAVSEGLLQFSEGDVQPILAAYDGPVLITHGAHDRHVRPEMATSLQALRPGTRLSVYAQSGHSPFYEEPDQFNLELADFVMAATDR